MNNIEGRKRERKFDKVLSTICKKLLVALRTTTQYSMRQIHINSEETLRFSFDFRLVSLDSMCSLDKSTYGFSIFAKETHKSKIRQREEAQHIYSHVSFARQFLIIPLLLAESA